VGTENIFKPTIGSENLHQDSNDNGVRIVKFATSKYLHVNSTMIPHRNIYQHSWTTPDGKTYNRIDHILKERRLHSGILDVRFFRGADCDTDHCLVVENVRVRLAVKKEVTQMFDRERFKLRKLNELEIRKEYEIEITNRFAALWNLSDVEDINRAWEKIKENIKTSDKESLCLYELKQHKPWLDEECLRTFRSKEAG
jgi:hypothetical protein